MAEFMTLRQAVQFCQIFNNPDFIDGRIFEKERLKRLSESDRKICWTALDTIEKARLSDWSSDDPENTIDGARIRDITSQITEEAEPNPQAKPSWYKVPFIWIAKTVHQFALWFRNTFLGRVSTKKLLDKVETYREDANNAIDRVRKINADDIPKIQHYLDEKIAQRDEVIQQRVKEEIIPAYQILLHLKEKIAGENLVEQQIQLGHIDGVPDLQVVPFRDIIINVLRPHLDVESSDVEDRDHSNNEQAPQENHLHRFLHPLYQAALTGDGLEPDEGEEISLDDLFDQTFNLIEEAYNTHRKKIHQLVFAFSEKESFEWDKIEDYGPLKLQRQKKVLADEAELLTKKYEIQQQ